MKGITHVDEILQGRRKQGDEFRRDARTISEEIELGQIEAAQLCRREIPVEFEEGDLKVVE